MTELKMPERHVADGQCHVERCRFNGVDGFVVRVETAGQPYSLVVSTHNAWRLFGMLALMLGVRLPRQVMKSIKL